MPDIKQSIATISATPFPPKMVYTKISTANKRVQELEAELAAVKAKAATSAQVPAGQSQPTQKPNGYTSTEQLMTAALRMRYADRSLLEKPENERRAALAGIFWSKRLRYPGSESDEKLIDKSKVRREIDDSRYTGAERLGTAFLQATFFDKALK